MKNIGPGLLLLSAFLLSFVSIATASEGVAMAEHLRASGKIYAVVAVLLIIFAGIVVYLIRFERKISRLEEEEQTRKQAD